MVGEVAADPRPARALVRLLRTLDAEAALAAALFEAVHYRLTPFADDELPEVAAAIYRRLDRPDPAWLLGELARQLRPQHGRTRAAPGDASDIAMRADAMMASYSPGAVLLLALEALHGDPAQSAALFEAVWSRQTPLIEYWVYHRMAEVYLALGRHDASALLAALAIQMLPNQTASDMPHRLLLGYFRDNGRTRDAAELVARRRVVCPLPALLSDAEFATLRDAAGALIALRRPAGRHDHVLFAAETRPPTTWRAYGGRSNGRRFADDVPHSLDELAGEMHRPAVMIAELHDAEVLLDAGAVGVFGPDGVPHTDLSLRSFPALMGRGLAEKRALGTPVEQIEVETAVLMCDEYPGPNLCHFLLDQAPRLTLYQRLGVDLRSATVIGPLHVTDYQRLIAPQLGLRNLLPANRCARVRAARLFVSSNCHHLRHPAHWAADWSLRPVRALFDLTPRRPARRLLVSRADARVRRVRNEAVVTELLTPLGFEVVVPGRMPFPEQVAAFRDASHIVAPHGAALANTLFCAPGTHVLEAFHPHYGTWAYAMLGAALGLDYASMIGRDGDSDDAAFNDPALPREARAANSGRDIRIDIDELERWLGESAAW